MLVERVAAARTDDDKVDVEPAATDLMTRAASPEINSSLAGTPSSLARAAADPERLVLPRGGKARGTPGLAEARRAPCLRRGDVQEDDLGFLLQGELEPALDSRL